MRELVRWRLATAAALLVVLGMTMGCAQKIGDLDRTQPNLIEKSQFQTDDEWFMQQTVVDTDMQGSMIFAALQGDLKRVRWTVTERVLYAHSTMELADDLNEGFDDPETRRTGVVAAFPIQGHFDVQRAYNSATGEPSNVIMENASDRPWYERDYMRVDWSRNMVEGFRMLGMYLGMAPVQYNYPQEDGGVNPHRTRITDDVIDTVTEYSFNPDIFACYGAYGYDTIFSCEGGRVTMRAFFMRVPEEETYVPMNYTDTRLLTRDGTEYGEPLRTASVFDSALGYEVEVECNEDVNNWMLERDGTDSEGRCSPATFEQHAQFGYFRTERVAWDRFVGTADDTRRYYVNRWNIWQTMLEDGEVLPMEERVPKPITFHLNLEYPEFMFDAAQETAHEWDLAFRGAVLAAQGITDEELDAVLEEEYGHTNMFRIVENSCHPGPLVEWRNTFGTEQADDRGSVQGIFQDYVGNVSGDNMERALWDLSNEARTNLCAELEFATETRANEEEQFTWERFGDLRYSFFNWVESAVPWAGYGPSSADPMTGELIAGNANFAGGYIRNIATYAADLVQYFNGELEELDIIGGDHIRRQLHHDSDTATDRFGLTPEASQEMALRFGVNPEEASNSNFGERPAVEDLHPFILKHGPDRMMREADLHSLYDSKRAARDERLVNFLKNPEVKNFLLGSTETQMAIEAQTRERFGPDFDAEQEMQVYLDFHTPRIANERMMERDRLLQERNIMTMDALAQMAESLVTYDGVADFYKGKDRTDIIERFMNGMFIGTQLHEIGHTVGLRHNFSASTDALNYHDEYWKIEQAVVEGRITREEAYSLQGPLANEIIGQDVDYASQTEFQLASVMDYTGDLTGRFAGLGKYDLAAINFAYGEVVEQWADDIELPNLLSYDTWLSDYKELPLVFADSYGGTEAEVYAAGIDIILNGRTFVPIQDVIDSRVAGILDNTERWSTYSFGPGNEPHIDRSVAYEFCSDEFRGRVLNCAVFDFGANQTEIVNHTFDTYRALQTFWRYRRHNISRGFENYGGYINRLFRTFQSTQEPFRYFSFYQWYDLGAYTDDLRRASIDAFNFYNEVLATPEKGRFCQFDSNNTTVDENWFFNLQNTYVPARFHGDAGNCDDFIDIPDGVGQLYNFSFSDEYDYRIDRVGSFIDKMMASQMIFDISANFAQSAFLTDFRATSNSYYTVFQDEMLQMMRGVLLGDYQNYGGVVDSGNYEVPVSVNPQTFGTGLENPQNGAPRFYTPQSVNHEFNMLVGGMIYNSGWENRTVDFSHMVKIAVADGELQPFGPGVPIKEFIHPVTYQVYQVADIEDRTIAGQMIDRANYLADRYMVIKEQLDQTPQGAPEYNQLRRVADHRLEQMQNVVSKMDMTRFIFEALGASAQY